MDSAAQRRRRARACAGCRRRRQGCLGERDPGNLRADDRRRNHLESRNRTRRRQTSISAMFMPSMTTEAFLLSIGEGEKSRIYQTRRWRNDLGTPFHQPRSQGLPRCDCLLGCRSWDRHGRPGRRTIHDLDDRRRRHDLEAIAARARCRWRSRRRRSVRRQWHVSGRARRS